MKEGEMFGGPRFMIRLRQPGDAPARHRDRLRLLKDSLNIGLCTSPSAAPRSVRSTSTSRITASSAEGARVDRSMTRSMWVWRRIFGPSKEEMRTSMTPLPLVSNTPATPH